jgi:hypothetical protein
MWAHWCWWQRVDASKNTLFNHKKFSTTVKKKKEKKKQRKRHIQKCRDPSQDNFIVITWTISQLVGVLAVM